MNDLINYSIAQYQQKLDLLFEAYKRVYNFLGVKMDRGQYTVAYQGVVTDFLKAKSEVSLARADMLYHIENGRPSDEFQMYAHMNPGEE